MLRHGLRQRLNTIGTANRKKKTGTAGHDSEHMRTNRQHEDGLPQHMLVRAPSGQRTHTFQTQSMVSISALVPEATREQVSALPRMSNASPAGKQCCFNPLRQEPEVTCGSWEAAGAAHHQEYRGSPSAVRRTAPLRFPRNTPASLLTSDGFVFDTPPPCD